MFEIIIINFDAILQFYNYIFQALTLNIFIYLYISFLIVLYNIIADIYRISSEQNFINKIFTKNLKILKFVKINIDNNYSKLMQSLI